MKPIKLPFGLTENKLVHISEVVRGKRCNCICPSCKVPLIASKGVKIQPHFKHAVECECEGGFESAVHLAAKQIIIEKGQITLPKLECHLFARDSKGKEDQEFRLISEKMLMDFDLIQEEVELYDMIADLLAKKKGKPLIIEIFYRHKVDDCKILKITKANISAIEIDLSRLTPNDVHDWDSFWEYINSVANIKWLHNVKMTPVQIELEEELKKRIEVREKKYKHEEHEKQKQLHLEQKMLLKALDELKLLSGQENITTVKLQAKKHPLWKSLPFSCNELPEFLNVEVPDGDWIFGCDRRIWQTAFYNIFILRNEKPFPVKSVDIWLKKLAGVNVSDCLKTIGRHIKCNPDLIPVKIYANPPSTWRTIRAYFNHLCSLGMLQYSGNNWFRVISKHPQAMKG